MMANLAHANARNSNIYIASDSNLKKKKDFCLWWRGGGGSLVVEMSVFSQEYEPKGTMCSAR